MPTIREVREAQVGTVDLAGRTVGGDMEGNATKEVTVPENMVEISYVKALYTTDKGALGSSCGMAVLYGPGLEDGEMHIPLGGGGAEIINASNDGLIATLMGPMGIRVKEGQDIYVAIQMTGEDSGDIVGSLELIFSDKYKSPAKKWVGFEIQLTSVDVDVQTSNLSGTTTEITTPIDSNRGVIDSIILALGGDCAALGSGGHAVLKLSGHGIQNDQHILIGGYSGENITEKGDMLPPVFEDNCDIPVKRGKIYSECRMVGEDCGTLSVAGSLAFIQSGGRGGPRGGRRRLPTIG